MKKKIQSKPILNLLSIALLLLSFTACKKDASIETSVSAAQLQSAVAATQAIAVSASATTAGDSVYVVNACERTQHIDSVNFNSLPAAVSTYLTANYGGYTFSKAFADKNSSGNITGYVVVIMYNNKPVGLKFDATGAFVKVLEQREGRDLTGHGWHNGGCFDDRDGLKRDTIILSALPSSITSYFAANYPQDTLVSAFRNRDSSIIVLSINNGTFATIFSSAGVFVKRESLPARPGHPATIAQTALPAAAQNYLTSTYPNYVYKHGFVLKTNGVITGYVVLIDANNTKYALEFDASGNFVKAVTVR